MKIVKTILKWIFYILLIPGLYFGIALILTAITVNNTTNNTSKNHTIYLSTNGVHLDIVIPKQDIDTALLQQINPTTSINYIAFGWGDENFYLHTPTWNDLTFGNTVQALFLESSTLMHVTRYRQVQQHWVKINISSKALQQLNQYIHQSFEWTKNNNITLLPNQGYSRIDDFYKAKGSYSCLHTCNSWANEAFKESGLRACYWTPFDFGLMGKYE